MARRLPERVGRHVGPPLSVLCRAAQAQFLHRSVLQGAIDHCNNANDDTANGVVSACPLFTIIDAATADQCDLAASVRENVVSNSTKLPG